MPWTIAPPTVRLGRPVKDWMLRDHDPSMSVRQGCPRLLAWHQCPERPTIQGATGVPPSFGAAEVCGPSLLRSPGFLGDDETSSLLGPSILRRHWRCTGLGTLHLLLSAQRRQGVSTAVCLASVPVFELKGTVESTILLSGGCRAGFAAFPERPMIQGATGVPPSFGAAEIRGPSLLRSPGLLRDDETSSLLGSSILQRQWGCNSLGGVPLPPTPAPTRGLLLFAWHLCGGIFTNSPPHPSPPGSAHCPANARPSGGRSGVRGGCLCCRGR